MKVPALNDFTRLFRDPIWTAVADTLVRRHEIGFTSLRRSEQGENIVFLLDDEFILKIYTPLKNGYHRELAGLNFAQGKTSIPLPYIVQHGEFEGYNYLITTQVDGRPMSRAEWLDLDPGVQVGFIRKLARGLKELHNTRSSAFDFDWHEFLEIQVASALEKQRREGGNPEWLESMPAYFELYLPLIPSKTADAFMHGDVHFGNLRVEQSRGELHICGLFDLADSLKGFHEYEFIAVGVLMIQGQGELQREFFREYGYPEDEIDETLRHRMFLLTVLYEHSSLRRYCERLGVEPMAYKLEKLERAIWNF